MLLIKNGDIYAPEHLGKMDILLGGGKILAMGQELSPNLPELQTYDAAGKILVPGFIDQHVHAIGGGGEGGLHTRVPELALSDAIRAGVTTLVGLLGTDGITKTVESLVAKTKELNNEGITAYCLTGSYQYPSPTLTGSVMKDLVYVQEIIGCKLALSDHRCSHPTKEELIRLVSDIRMAALVAGKPGVLHIHTGACPDGIQPIMDIINTTDIPPYHFRPTHLERHLDQAIAFTKMGGYSDLSTGPKVPALIHRILKEAVTERITFSSDANGSLPKWDAKHENIVGMGVGKMTTLFGTVRTMVKEEKVPLETVLPFITSNVAEALAMSSRKGHLKVGSDGDVVLLDDDLTIGGVVAMGKWMMKDGEILVKGTFEE